MLTIDQTAGGPALPARTCWSWVIYTRNHSVPEVLLELKRKKPGSTERWGAELESCRAPRECGVLRGRAELLVPLSPELWLPCFLPMGTPKTLSPPPFLVTLSLAAPQSHCPSWDISLRTWKETRCGPKG